MLLIRCTAKLRKEMGLKEAALYDGDAPGSPLDTWYANLLRISRRKCVLFTHADSLFSFLTFDASKARLKNLDIVFHEGLEEAMTREGFDNTVISRLLVGYEDARYTKTDSRSVLGSMNDIALNYNHDILYNEGAEYCDLPSIILKLNRVPFMALGSRYPIEKFAGLLGIDRKILLTERLAALAGSGAVYQLRVVLRESDPAIWRRLLVQDVTLGKLSDYLIAAMGWMGGHLHMFSAGGKRYSDPDPEWCDPDLLDEGAVKLSDIVSVKHRSFIYEYDLGDSWEHEVTVENIGSPEPARRYPVCLDGGLACPPEDVGGIGGFYEFLEAVVSPAHPEHDRMLTWAGGGYDPEAFDLDQTNRALIASVMQGSGWWEFI